MRLTITNKSTRKPAEEHQNSRNEILKRRDNKGDRRIQESSPAVTRTPMTAIMKTIILNFQIKTLYIRQSPKKGQQKRGKLPPFP
ncbi:hypothetical protein [Succinimonas sp.]|uniref:hypothetical protein n=1 Tax=Succinimonas sp. TaxID=1936151 RepID=UPI003863C9E3